MFWDPGSSTARRIFRDPSSISPCICNLKTWPRLTVTRRPLTNGSPAPRLPGLPNPIGAPSTSFGDIWRDTVTAKWSGDSVGELTAEIVAGDRHVRRKGEGSPKNPLKFIDGDSCYVNAGGEYSHCLLTSGVARFRSSGARSQSSDVKIGLIQSSNRMLPSTKMPFLFPASAVTRFGINT